LLTFYTFITMECTITKDDLKIVLLKCVGSKYPTRIVCANQSTRSAFIRGFYDADCTVVLVSETEDTKQPNQLALQEIIRIETIKAISYDRARSKIFNVN
jgi:hypothetical protein